MPTPFKLNSFPKNSELARFPPGGRLPTAHYSPTHNSPWFSAAAPPSLIKQYLEAKNDLVSLPHDPESTSSPANTESLTSRRLTSVAIAKDKPAEPAKTPAIVEPVPNKQLTVETLPAGSLRP